MTGRAKWDAWSTVGKTYNKGADAENRYLTIARSLGWEEGTTLAPESERDSEVDLDNISDEDSTGGGGGPMGGTVSSMARLDEEIDLNTLHGLAVSDEGRKLEMFLQDHPNIDINGLNEHGYTALHLAADRGHVALVEILLSKGADPSIKDSDDFTPPELARIAGHDEVGIILDKALK